MSTSTAPAPAAPEEITPAPAPPATVVGNLTADPELRFSSSGKGWATFTIASDRPKVPGDWAGPRETTYVECVVFGSLAENAAETLRKGDRAIVSGRPELRELPEKDGMPAKTVRRLVANAAGVELRFATAAIARTARRGPATPGSAPAGGDPDPWADLAPASSAAPF